VKNTDLGSHMPQPGPEAKTRPACLAGDADLLTVSEARADATLVGCRPYDLTNGWGGHPGCGVPLRPERVHPCYHTKIVHS
jgi:hypothetical protein